MDIIFQYLSGFRHHFDRSSPPRRSLHSNNSGRSDSHIDQVNDDTFPTVMNNAPQNAEMSDGEPAQGLLLPPHEIHNSREHGSAVNFPFEGFGLLSNNNGPAISGASTDSEEVSYSRQNVLSSLGGRFYAKNEKQPLPPEYHEQTSKIGTIGKRKRHVDEAGSSLAAVEALLCDSRLEEKERKVKRARLRPLPKTVFKRTIRTKRPSNVPRHSDSHQHSAMVPAYTLHQQQSPLQPLRSLHRQLAYQQINPTGRSNFENRAAPRPLRRDEDLICVSAAGVPEVQRCTRAQNGVQVGGIDRFLLRNTGTDHIKPP